jgi:hypothetical protein
MRRGKPGGNNEASDDDRHRGGPFPVFVGEALATEWNVSVWGQRRAFTEHIH